MHAHIHTHTYTLIERERARESEREREREAGLYCTFLAKNDDIFVARYHILADQFLGLFFQLAMRQHFLRLLSVTDDQCGDLRSESFCLVMTET
jgi:hypothetical protein